MSVRAWGILPFLIQMLPLPESQGDETALANYDALANAEQSRALPEQINAAFEKQYSHRQWSWNLVRNSKTKTKICGWSDGELPKEILSHIYPLSVLWFHQPKLHLLHNSCIRSYSPRSLYFNAPFFSIRLKVGHQQFWESQKFTEPLRFSNAVYTHLTSV